MALTKKTDHVTEAQGNFIEQFKGKTNLDALMAAWVQQVQDLEDALFEIRDETNIDNAVGVQLDVLGRIVGVDREGRTDADFRVAINARIGLNIGSGTIEEILEQIVALGATNIEFLDVYPAAFDIEINDAVTNGSEIANVVNDAKPAAVRASVTWHESTNPFLFGVSGQGFDQGELGEIAVF